MVFLFGLLLRENRGQCKPARDVSMLVYLLHPWCIVAVRGVAKVCGLRAVLVDLPLVHFILVTVLSFFGAYMVRRLWPRRSSKTARAWREIDCQVLTANAYALRDVYKRQGVSLRIFAGKRNGRAVRRERGELSLIHI